MNNAVLIAPGPSFNPEHLLSYHELGDCYTINRALRAYIGREPLIPKGAFFMDSASLFEEERPMLVNENIEKIVNSKKKASWAQYPNVIWFEYNEELVKKREVPYLTTVMAWLALTATRTDRPKYKRIFLVGVDCQFEGDKPYFLDNLEIKGEQGRLRRKNYNRCYDFLKAQLPAAREVYGVETINLSPASKLADFMPTMTVAEAMKLGEEQ